MPSDDQKRTHRGPWYHRALVWTFGILFGLLAYWLLGFILSDVGTWPGPQYEKVEQEVLDQKLVSQKEDLDQQLETVKEDVDAKQERQDDLRDSTDSAEKTMNRLLDIQRLALEKERDLSEKEKQSLQEAKDLFLSNQKQYQRINEEIADLKQKRRKLEEQEESLDSRLDQQREEAREEYQQRQLWHDMKMAAIQLSVVVPLLIISALAFVHWRTSLYTPLIYACAAATALKAGMIMHEHFPARYFKYILILVAIAIVGALLVRLLKHMARPATDWLMQQYREAYERFVCPVCEYPIRRGPLRFHYWNRRSIKKLSLSLDASSADEMEPYVCPCCATMLYDSCEQCEHLRPALMTACPHCGKERSPQEILAAVGEGGEEGSTDEQQVRQSA